MAFGTLTTLDTLAALNGTTVADYGEDRLWESIEAYFEIHNTIVNDMLMDLAERSPDVRRRYGGLDTMVMEVASQFGRPDAQKITAGVTVGFPLRLYEGSLQWTRKYFQTATVGELARQVRGLFTADVIRLQAEIKKALMFTSNYTFIDILVDGTEVAVKRLVNADSAAIPIAPDGSTFNAATHTHYLGTGSFVAADLSALIDTVAEHEYGGEVRVYINKAQEATVRGFTGFEAYTDPRLIYDVTETRARGTVDLRNQSNRAIGIFDEAEVWVKPWVPASYVVCLIVGAGERPLVMRVRAGGGDLALVANDESYPLRAQTYEREYGFGVWNRTMAAVLYTGNATYANPSL